MIPTCSWPGRCSQLAWEGSLCCYHTKLATGLIDGRDSIHSGKPRDAEFKALGDNLVEAGADPEVVERARKRPPVPRLKRSLSDGGGMPQGRLHLAGW